ncbi:ParB N-terminal domain-containing protein [Tumebacillus lipolyticus]|uniref:ParB N-terminal domain-containing protein n=1 Tax=Tumebacillus lipolyticus TaxID=1280370 RepID=A0ABW5A1Q3_9BACL
MYDVVSDLKVVDIDQICLHETHECVRLEKTCQSILTEGVLRNPPLAAQMRDGRYLILDGAHRTCSLQKLGCLRSVVQLVNADFFQLEAWHHVVPDGAWLQELLTDPDLRIEAIPLSAPAVASLVNGEGKELFFYAAKEVNDPSARLRAWHRVVTSYSQNYAVKRVACGEVERPEAGSVLMRYPATTLEELDALVSCGQVMPAGVTRCIVQGRMLNLRVPLDLLTAPVFQEEVWAELCDRWKRSLRLYSEAVYLCEV